MFELNIRFQIAAFLMWLLIVVDYRRNSHLQLLSTKCFRTLLILTGLNLVFDGITVYTVNHINEVPVWFNDLVHKLFLGSIVIIMFFNFLYVYILANNQRRIKTHKMLLLLIPIFISAIIILFGKLDYRITENAAYSYGTLVYVVYVCGILYLISAFSLTVNKKIELNTYQRHSIRTGLAIWFIILMVQMIFPRLLLSGLGLILMVLSVYFSFENQKENYDAMIRCFNKTAFHRMICEYNEKGKDMYLLSVSCDNFEHINNISGYDCGLDILKSIVKVLKKYFGNYIYHSENNTLSVFRSSETDDDYLNKIFEELSQIKFDKFEIRFHIKEINLGKYIVEVDDTYETLDFMSNELKGRESGIYSLNEDMWKRKQRHDSIVHIVSESLKNDGFEMFYQPIYNTAEKCFSSAEALLRFKKSSTKDLGFVSPEEFIPIAEEKGMIVELGDRVFEMVARDIKNHNMLDFGIGYIEVNLSRIQTVAVGIAEHLKNLISEYGISPEFLNLEITETASVSSEEILTENMKSLKQAGFSLSMDDFGTGYSNLSQINKSDYELIKLDKSIIWPAFDEKADEASKNSAEKILECSINMIKSMGIKIVAEGVETKEMVDYLTEHGVDYLQGYYFSRPINSDEFMEFIKGKAVS